MSVVKWPDHRALPLDLKIVIASTLVLLLLLCLWRLFFMLTDWAAVFLLLLACSGPIIPSAFRCTGQGLSWPSVGIQPCTGC